MNQFLKKLVSASSRPRHFINGGLLCLMLLLPWRSSADTFNICVTLSGGAPVTNLPWSLVFSNNFNNVIASTMTNSSGCASVTDAINTGTVPESPATPGTQRCITGISRPGWSLNCTQQGSCYFCNPPQSPGADYCVTDPAPITNCVLRRNLSSAVTVVGGSHGYVNPNAGDVATFVIAAPHSPDVTINIYSLRGERVATLQKRVTINVQDSVTWDCKNLKNETVASGIYVAHIYNEGAALQKVKIAVVKK